MPDYLKVSTVAEVAPGKSKVVTVKGEEVALFNVDGKFYACANSCVHQGGPLSEGPLQGNIVTCPWHNWKYDVTTGCTTFDPSMKVTTYETKVEDQDVFIRM